MRNLASAAIAAAAMFASHPEPILYVAPAVPAKVADALYRMGWNDTEGAADSLSRPVTFTHDADGHFDRDEVLMALAWVATLGGNNTWS